jgi:hypothetical protein
MVPSADHTEYDAAWGRLHVAATTAGAHAWRFASAKTPGLFLEFLEFASDSGLREDPTALAAIQALHERFGDPYPPPDTLEEWSEIPHSAP